MIDGMHTIWCQTSDMDRSVAFYRDVLGLAPTMVTPYWSQFDLEGGSIGLHPPVEGSTPPYAQNKKGWVLGLRTSDLAGLRVRLEASGAEVDTQYHETPGGPIFGFRDPDGTPIQAIQMGAKIADLGPGTSA